jgi:hypothetical protein
MSRYVILEHDYPTRHWDFMLEAGPFLRTWRLSAPPEEARIVIAQATFDHRLCYLDYEGPVSGDRGRVSRWDTGSFEWRTDEPNEIAVVLEGSRLRGVAILSLQQNGEWRLQWEGRGPDNASAEQQS